MFTQNQSPAMVGFFGFQSKGSLPKTNASFGGSAFRVLQIVKRFCESNTGLVHSYDGIVRVSMGFLWDFLESLMAYAVFTAHDASGLLQALSTSSKGFLDRSKAQICRPSRRSASGKTAMKMNRDELLS